MLSKCPAGTALRDTQLLSDMLDTETATRGAQKVSPHGLLQDDLAQGQVGYGAPQAGVFGFEFLEAFDLTCPIGSDLPTWSLGSWDRLC